MIGKRSNGGGRNRHRHQRGQHSHLKIPTETSGNNNAEHPKKSQGSTGGRETHPEFQRGAHGSTPTVCTLTTPNTGTHAAGGFCFPLFTPLLFSSPRRPKTMLWTELNVCAPPKFMCWSLVRLSVEVGLLRASLRSDEVIRARPWCSTISVLARRDTKNTHSLWVQTPKKGPLRTEGKRGAKCDPQGDPLPGPSPAGSLTWDFYSPELWQKQNSVT